MDTKEMDYDEEDSTAPDPDTLLAEANRRLIEAEIIVAATAAGYADPHDAVTLAANAVNINSDGQVEGATEAVAALLEQKPYLAGQTQPRFTVPGDGGAGGPPLITREALKEMTPGEVNRARKQGLLDHLTNPGGRFQ